MKKKIIGLCGGSGSGKGMVGNFFSENGYLTVDTDKVYRDLTTKSSSCLDALVCEFGKEILTAEGILDRRKLSEIVFSNKEKHARLNEITHKFVLGRVRKIINESQDSYRGFVVDAPLLYESGFDKSCDFVVAVVADLEKRLDRIVVRDSIPRDAALKRIRSQISDDDLMAKADFVIENNSGLDSLKLETKKIIKKIQG